MAEVSPAERVIVALDVPTIEEAYNLVRSLPLARFFKIGLEAITAGIAHQVLELAQAQGARVFWDGKFLDIDNTVVSAAKALPEGVAVFNVHAFVGRNTLVHAAEVANGRVDMKALAVTILTDKTHEDLVDLGLAESYRDPEAQHFVPSKVELYKYQDMQRLVLRLAKLAYDADMHGVVCSPKELPMLRAEFPHGFLLVTPGIRPTWAATNDQKRIITPTDAGRDGADYIVVGRPITAPPEGLSPADAFDRVVEEFATGIIARSS